MSEYQYYEFRAIDRPLDDKQMGELRGLRACETFGQTPRLTAKIQPE